MKSYKTQNGKIFSKWQIEEICNRIDRGDDWQRIINDEIWEKVDCCEDSAWEVYDHCEVLVSEKYLQTY